MRRATIFILLGFHAAVLLAAWLAPYDYAEQHREYPYAAPTPIHFAPWPFVYGVGDPQRVYPIRFFTNGRLFGVDPGGVIFLAGTDAYGRDVFSRILYGGQISI